MKTSLSHLPENKQHEIPRITEIIKEVVQPQMWGTTTQLVDEIRAAYGDDFDHVLLSSQG